MNKGFSNKGFVIVVGVLALVVCCGSVAMFIGETEKFNANELRGGLFVIMISEAITLWAANIFVRDGE